LGDVIGLQDRQLIENQEFVSDLARFSESLLTEKFIRKKYGNLDEASWTRLAENEELVSKIEMEKLRRQRDGSSKREKSQQLITKAPGILDSIMSGGNEVSPRHKIDAIRTLDGMAANGPGETTPMSDRFQITIVLSADSSGSEPAALHFNKSIRVLEPGEVDPDDSGPDTGMIAVIAAKKTESGGGQESI
jgi:hypothetical protein